MSDTEEGTQCDGHAGESQQREWLCVCEHNSRRHRDQQGNDEANYCLDCDCPEFCTPEDADEINEALYEIALADGEEWATEAHAVREAVVRAGDGPTQGELGCEHEPATASEPAIVCEGGCGRSTIDPDKWDPEAETGRVFCDACWPRRTQIDGSPAEVVRDG